MSNLEESTEEQVTISREEHRRLRYCAAVCECMREHGVEAWDGYFASIKNLPYYEDFE